MKNYIKNNPLLNLSRIEKEMGINPQAQSLSKWLRGVQELSPKWHDKLEEVLIKHTSYKIDE